MSGSGADIQLISSDSKKIQKKTKKKNGFEYQKEKNFLLMSFR